ncbi:response regulator [Microvirga flavescens]|uniref:response regulator n=1 Tax=Microvirga flavescens TaxID=2249811 RepID=UPI000DD5C1A5|nr:response regulator [Microvirga flavescens]
MSRQPHSLKTSFAASSCVLILGGLVVAGFAFVKGEYFLAAASAAVFLLAAIVAQVSARGQAGDSVAASGEEKPQPPVESPWPERAHAVSHIGVAGWRSSLTGPAKQNRDTDEKIERMRVVQKLDAVNRLRGGVAHDLNNKLMIISANVDAVAKQIKDQPTLQRKLLSALVASDQAAALISKVLTFTRRNDPEVQYVDVAKQIGSVAMLLGRSFRSSGVDVRCSMVDKLWPVRVDPQELEATIVHLGVYIRDAMPNGATVTIEAANRSLERGALANADLFGDCVQVTIHGTQPSLPVEDAGGIVDPLLMSFEAHDASGDPGLDQVLAFVRESGGAVEIGQLVEGSISAFLYLPRAELPARIGAHDGSDEAIADDGKISADILVVDDELEVALALQSMLEESGYAVRIATGVDEAVAKLNRNKPDLIIADVTMPGPMDGVTFAREIRQAHPDLPVVLLTGNTVVPEEWSEFTLLHKPIVSGDLDAAIQRHLPRPNDGKIVPLFQA